MKNFKSFKRAHIPFAKGFTTIAGPNGAGKCVTGETEVLLGSGESRQIQDIASEFLEKADRKQFLEDGVIGFIEEKGLEVISLNPRSMKIEKKRVSAVVKKTCPKRLLEVTTRTGKKVTATEYHPFFSVSEKGIYPIKAGELKEGMFIAVPRTINAGKKSLFLEELAGCIEPKDSMYVPFNERYLQLIKEYLERAGLTAKEAARAFNIPFNAIKGIKDGDMAGGFCEGIRVCGELLTKQFTVKPKDINELPNRLIIKQ